MQVHTIENLPQFSTHFPHEFLSFCLDAKGRKNQGGELLDGGLFIDAAPFCRRHPDGGMVH
jgi:hypothetical protein